MLFDNTAGLQASECLVVDVNNVDKYEIVLEMKELASKGMAAEVVEGVNSMDPNFFGQNPLLLFQLKQVLQSWTVSSDNFIQGNGFYIYYDYTKFYNLILSPILG